MQSYRVVGRASGPSYHLDSKSICLFTHYRKPKQLQISNNQLFQYNRHKIRVYQGSEVALRIDEKPETLSKYFKRWLKKQKIDVSGVDIDIVNGQVQVTASKDFPPNSTIFAIPKEHWISLDQVKQSNVPRSCYDLEPWLQLVLLILYERAEDTLGVQPYLNLLLKTSESPLYWTESQQELLKGTQIYQQMTNYREFFEERYRKLMAQQLENKDIGSGISFDSFVKAIAGIRSHVHAPLEKDQIALVPVADLLQHSSVPNVEWKVEQTGFIQKTEQLAVKSVQFVKEGDVLYMDFKKGASPSSILLDYGKLDAGNPKIGYSYSLTLPTNDKFYYDKLDTLEQRERGATSEFVIYEGEEPPMDMMAILRLIALSGLDLFLLEAVFRLELWTHVSLPVSRENEDLMIKSITNGIDAALAGYPTTLAQDEELIKKTKKGSRERKAIQIRIGEKKSLISLKQWFVSYEAKVPTFEFYQERRLKRLGLTDEFGQSTYNPNDDPLSD